MTGTVLQDPASNGSARPERGPGGPSVKDSVLMVGTVVDLELRQRVRSVAWYVLLGVAALVLAAVTLLLLATAGAFGGEGGDQVVSVVVYLVLLLGTLVTPALSGAAVNGDRDAGTLATTQITLVGTWQLLLGKFLAAWTAALAFLAVASPFLLIALVAGGRAGDAEITATLAADDTATGRESAALARAAIPTAEGKAAAWASVADSASLPNSTVRATTLGFRRAIDTSLLQPYVDRYFSTIEQLWDDRSYAIAEALARGLYPSPLASRDLVAASRQWLDANPEAPAALRRVVVENSAAVERALAAQARDARD